MAHRTLRQGTAYNVTGGKSLVSGTSYNISKGRTLVGGTGYDILFTPAIYAMLYTDGSMVFQPGSAVESGKTLSNSYTGFIDKSGTYWGEFPWYSYGRSQIVNVSFKETISPKSMGHWFFTASNLVNIDYTNCNLDNVTSMYNTFSGCGKLTGSPVCGNNVTDMRGTYSGCWRLTGSPVCGNKVTSMWNTYNQCNNITGSPVCGPNVINMCNTYWRCTNLTGSPVCGEKVIDMRETYSGCTNLTGSPVCGNNVTNMAYTYHYCTNLTGSPVCGNNVTNMAYTYFGCRNLAGKAYFYSTKVANIKSCFSGRDNSTALNIYVINGSTTHNTVLIANTYSLVGAAITWTDAGTHVYNTQYNIYIYPIDEDMETFRLNNEYSDSITFATDNSNGIETAEDQASIKTEWEYSAVETEIDSGQLFAMSINLSDLDNVNVEEMEVQ